MKKIIHIIVAFVLLSSFITTLTSCNLFENEDSDIFTKEALQSIEIGMKEDDVIELLGEESHKNGLSLFWFEESFDKKHKTAIEDDELDDDELKKLSSKGYKQIEVRFDKNDIVTTLILDTVHTFNGSYDYADAEKTITAASVSDFIWKFDSGISYEAICELSYEDGSYARILTDVAELQEYESENKAAIRFSDEFFNYERCLFDIDDVNVIEDISHYAYAEGSTAYSRILTGYAKNKISASVAVPYYADAFSADAFGEAKINTLVLHKYVTHLSAETIRSINGLKEIKIDEENETMQSKDGCVTVKDGTRLTLIMTIGEKAKLPIKTTNIAAGAISQETKDVILNKNIREISPEAFSNAENNTIFWCEFSETAAARIINSYKMLFKFFYYSEEAPTRNPHKYWHYDEEGNPTLWN